MNILSGLLALIESEYNAKTCFKMSALSFRVFSFKYVSVRALKKKEKKI